MSRNESRALRARALTVKRSSEPRANLVAVSRPWADRVLNVLDEIHARLDDETLEPSQLAERAGFSRHHFHRVFRGMTGESVMGLVRRLRMERAAQRLRFGHAPVTDVALASGYGSHEAFTRAFRERFGVAPREFRRETREAGSPELEARIEALPEIPVLSLRHTGSYETCHQVWDQLLAMVAARAGLDEVQGSFGLVYDDPDITEQENLRYDACVALASGAETLLREDSRLRLRTIPAGKYARARHVGPYDTMNPTYVALLGQWLPERDVELYDEPVVEIYLNDPNDTPPEALLSEICVRIHP